MKEIKLTNSDKVALVDDEDYELLNRHRWGIRPDGDTFYAQSSADGYGLTMHRLLMGSPPEINPNGTHIDHKDKNGLNNQKSNLRWATKSQNNSNRNKQKGNFTSQFKGVFWSELHQRWIASCSFQGIRKYKHFKHELDAAHGYDKLALDMQGEFAVLNFPT